MKMFDYETNIKGLLQTSGKFAMKGAESVPPVKARKTSDPRRAPPLPQPPPDRSLARQHLYAEQIRLLYRFSLVGYLAELMVTFVLGAILWEALAGAVLYLWFVSAVLLIVGRYGLYYLFIRANPDVAHLRLWETRFVIGSGIMATLWTVMGTALLPAAQATQLPVIMLIALLTTGSVAYYAPHRTLFGVTSILSLVPMSIMLTFAGSGRTAIVIGAALLMLTILLAMVHKKVYRAIQDAISTRFDNLIIEQRNRMHLERTPLGVMEWNLDFRITSWNPAAEKIFGFSAAEMLGQKVDKLVATAKEGERLATMWMRLLQFKASSRVSLVNRTKDGEVIHAEWHNTPLIGADRQVIGVASMVQDVTERVNTERIIHYMAHHDALTDLPNRRLMHDRLNQAILHARRRQRHVGLLFLDLDRFKLINDTLGHEAGDFVLRDIARRLGTMVREGDTVSREGGDEYMIVLPDLEKPESAQLVANKILAELAKPTNIDGRDVTVTASIGISHFPDDATDAQELIKRADSAMYQAKDAGRNTGRFYVGDTDFLESKRLERESRLRRGVENNEFFLRYQPQIGVKSGRIVGFEALLRWNDPELGEIMPKDFIGLAEELGLIVRLGEWVFRSACWQAKDWQTAGFSDVSMSINLSPRQFTSQNLLSSMKASLIETGVDPSGIDLEITESIAMRNIELSVAILSEMRRLGATISIDDFGVGYSSLGQLKSLPAQTLKIDASFIAQVPEDENSCSITEAIIAMGKRLKLRIVAEGVERHEQLEFLREQGCDAYQGYLFSKPITADEATALLNAQRANA